MSVQNWIRHVLPLGLEHLQSGLLLVSSRGTGILIVRDGPTTFYAVSGHPFSATWSVAGQHARQMASYPDSDFRQPAPETDAMIRARIERNNVLQRVEPLNLHAPLFRNLSPDEEASFREWARENYRPGERIKEEVWHPVVVDECGKMIAELGVAIRRHPKVPYGECPVCRHYGEDCTGLEADEPLINEDASADPVNLDELLTNMETVGIPTLVIDEHTDWSASSIIGDFEPNPDTAYTLVAHKTYAHKYRIEAPSGQAAQDKWERDRTLEPDEIEALKGEEFVYLLDAEGNEVAR